ncbi:lipoprotein-releasing ABC transporter permease subunit [Pseudoalteromonas ulvae]|uniref:Cell division protein FtsX n=1 Tax=Pseudoalteromonas ulvae TaxID=107327 RepID=A0A244CMZ4_PSEDV|nr:lipoprotein-releasing ABC transporter permease subunit [Pseudoalteromonas ulvae]OUL56955.1 cell division protein FtsX [Pseudoalteromonas ulvae]
MYQPVSLFIGLRYSRAAKGNAFISFISFFSITGITLGLIALITVISVMNGFEDKLKKSMLGYIPHISLENQNHTLEDVEQFALQFQSDPRINHITPYVKAEALLQTSAEIRPILLQGVFLTEQFTALQDKMTQGQWQRLFSTRYSIAMSQYLANKLQLRVGDQVRVIVPAASSFTPVGRVPSQRLFTLVATFSTGSEVDTALAFTRGEFVSRLLKTSPEKVPEIAFELNDAFLIDEILNDYHIHFSQFTTTDWRATQGTLFSAVAMEKRIMSLLLGLIILVAVFNIVSALIMMVGEKQSEVAILQTLGLTPAKIQQVFIVQGLYNGVLGTVIGASLGVLFAANINEILAAVGLHFLGGVALPVLFEPMQLTLIFTSSIAMSFIATLYPAAKAAAIRPAEVLRYE